MIILLPKPGFEYRITVQITMNPNMVTKIIITADLNQPLAVDAALT